MAYYSFVVIAPQPMGIPKPVILLDTGMNVFSVVVDDIDELLGLFENEGVRVVNMNRLDNLEAVDPNSLFLEESAGLLSTSEVVESDQEES